MIQLVENPETSPMGLAAPHFLLFSESRRERSQGQWRFVLQSIDGSHQLEAADDEPDVQGERLELLAVVRGLEALEQPSRVTLVTPSAYVNRGLTYGLTEWRTNDWQWEHFGEMVPVKNRDLWQRVDRALAFHTLDCRTWRFDLPHLAAAPNLTTEAPLEIVKPRRVSLWRRWRLAWSRWCDDRVRGAALWLAQCGTRLLPLPWLE